MLTAKLRAVKRATRSGERGGPPPITSSGVLGAASIASPRPGPPPILHPPPPPLSAPGRRASYKQDLAEIRRRFQAASYQAGGQDWAALFRHYDRDNSGELSWEEFRRAVRKDARIAAGAVTDAALRKLFDSCDADGFGTIDAAEFTALLGARPAATGAATVTPPSPQQPARHRVREHVPPARVTGWDTMTAAQRRLAARVDAEARRLEPLLLSPERLDAVFVRWDVNGSAALSLAEIDKAVVELFPNYDHKPALMRAYKAADADADGRVGRAEFEKLLHYLIYFTDLWQQFDEIDADHDQRLDLGEFARASALVRPSCRRCGRRVERELSGCRQVGHEMGAEEARAEFERMHGAGGGALSRARGTSRLGCIGLRRACFGLFR